MVKREFKPLTWKVKNYLINENKIWDYDVLKYREDQIKKLKKKCVSKEEFAKELLKELFWQYWGRCEYEVIIEIDDNNRIWLKPWVGCIDPESVKIDVTDEESFDWEGFAEKHIGEQIYQSYAKIDVWNQLEFRWTEFIDYVWNYRHKYQRKKVAIDEKAD